MAGCVHVHTEGEREHIECAALFSLPSNLLPRNQDFHRVIVWETSNNCASKADVMLLKNLSFLSASCRIKPQNFVTDQIWRRKSQQQDDQTLQADGVVSQPRHV